MSTENGALDVFDDAAVGFDGYIIVYSGVNDPHRSARDGHGVVAAYDSARHIGVHSSLEDAITHAKRLAITHHGVKYTVAKIALSISQTEEQYKKMLETAQNPPSSMSDVYKVAGVEKNVRAGRLPLPESSPSFAKQTAGGASTSAASASLQSTRGVASALVFLALAILVAFATAVFSHRSVTTVGNSPKPAVVGNGAKARPEHKSSGLGIRPATPFDALSPLDDLNPLKGTGLRLDYGF